MADVNELGASLRSWAEGFEYDNGLDEHVRWLQGIAALLVGSGRRLSFLQGQWLGHSFHPLLTDFPLGAWASASFLDLFGKENTRPASEMLAALGLAAAVPTALAGIADWSEADRGSKRVGVVHAGLNSAVAGFYASSLVARRKEHHSLGVALGVCGGLVAWASGYLGGHLSLVRDAGHDRNSGTFAMNDDRQDDRTDGGSKEESEEQRNVSAERSTASQSNSNRSQEDLDEHLEEASRDSFPASDPPAW
jgi:uncharacterized membrane protein